jgi:hypothetical protein
VSGPGFRHADNSRARAPAPIRPRPVTSGSTERRPDAVGGARVRAAGLRCAPRPAPRPDTHGTRRAGTADSRAYGPGLGGPGPVPFPVPSEWRAGPRTGGRTRARSPSTGPYSTPPVVGSRWSVVGSPAGVSAPGHARPAAANRYGAAPRSAVAPRPSRAVHRSRRAPKPPSDPWQTGDRPGSGSCRSRGTGRVRRCGGCTGGFCGGSRWPPAEGPAAPGPAGAGRAGAARDPRLRACGRRPRRWTPRRRWWWRWGRPGRGASGGWGRVRGRGGPSR